MKDEAGTAVIRSIVPCYPLIVRNGRLADWLVAGKRGVARSQTGHSD
jgi:hypothetical protein